MVVLPVFAQTTPCGFSRHPFRHRKISNRPELLVWPLERSIACLYIRPEKAFTPEMDMGWVNPWVGLDWVGLGQNFSVCNGLGWVQAMKIGVFYSPVIGILIIILLIILIY